MHKEIIFSGIGGQGVMLICEMVCAVASKKGYAASYTAFYGQEKRGGRTMAQIIIADKMGPIVVSEADLLLVMDEKSLKDFESKLKPGGVLLYNSDIVSTKTTRDDVQVMSIAANTIALDCGAAKAANMVALGAVLTLIGDIVTKEDIMELVAKKFAKKPKLIPANEAAVNAGFDKVVKIS